MPITPTPLHVLSHPYTHLEPVTRGVADLRLRGRSAGSALVWAMDSHRLEDSSALVERRPGGMALIVVLPPNDDVAGDVRLLYAVQRARPHGILPYHPGPSPQELAHVLRRPPTELGTEVVEYLRWRGLAPDRETLRAVRRIIDLSANLRSVSAVARSMYVSRRALGRRFLTRGLPVPSHWLHAGRLLRVAVRLQNTDATVASVAFEHGYSDGFAVSNQMERLLGYRPTVVRQRFGWEWIFEAWLRREADAGGLSPAFGRLVQAAGGLQPAVPGSLMSPSGPREGRARGTVHSVR